MWSEILNILVKSFDQSAQIKTYSEQDTPVDIEENVLKIQISRSDLWKEVFVDKNLMVWVIH